MIKKAFFYGLALFFFFNLGCAMAMESFFEQDQVNYQESLKNGSYSSKPIDPLLVEAVVVKEDVYKGGNTSFDTWPHRRFILKVKDGQLPTKKGARKFEYHTAHLDSTIKVGDVLTFVFNNEGKLYEVRKSIQDSTNKDK